MAVHKKLTKIQTEIKAPKNLFNDYGKYYYRNAESIYEAVKPFLAKEDCSLTVEDDVVQIGDRFYIKATVTLTDNKDGDSISVSAIARESIDKKGMDSSQITGATSSYARKYALNGLFLLDDTKDADSDEYKVQSDNVSKKEQKSNEKSAKVQKETPEEEKLNEEMRNSVDSVYLPTKDGKPSQEQIDKLHSEMERTGVSLEVLLQMYEVKKIEDMNDAMVISALNKFKITGDKK